MESHLCINFIKKVSKCLVTYHTYLGSCTRFSTINIIITNNAILFGVFFKLFAQNNQAKKPIKFTLLFGGGGGGWICVDHWVKRKHISLWYRFSVNLPTVLFGLNTPPHRFFWLLTRGGYLKRIFSKSYIFIFYHLFRLNVEKNAVN